MLSSLCLVTQSSFSLEFVTFTGFLSDFEVCKFQLPTSFSSLFSVFYFHLAFPRFLFSCQSFLLPLSLIFFPPLDLLFIVILSSTRFLFFLFFFIQSFGLIIPDSFHSYYLFIFLNTRQNLYIILEASL